jgi:hypothetical protein
MFRWLRRWRTGWDDDAGDPAALLPDVEELEELTRILREAREAVSLDTENRPFDDATSLSARRPLRP